MNGQQQKPETVDKMTLFRAFLEITKYARWMVR